MSVDQRTRLMKDIRSIPVEEVLDAVFPEAVAAHADVAGRGATYRELLPLGFDVDGVQFTLRADAGRLVVETGLAHAGVVARLDADALSNLVQDYQSTTGLAMTARVDIEKGTLDDWGAGEMVLRAVLDGRKV